MNDVEMVEKMCQLSEPDVAALDALTQEILQECREASRTIVGEWLKDSASGSANAAFVAGQIHELALHEMLNRVEAVSPDLRVGLMTTVLDTVLQFRTLLVEQLEPLLDDVRPVDSPPLTRACDAAYILICKLELRAKDITAERIFGDSSEDARDREIVEWKKARARVIAAAEEFD
jgi:hypothetical protein